jgi:hypothetical protein
MAPPQEITVVDPLPWSRSTVTRFALSNLVNGGQLAPNVDGQPPAWIVPPATDREPNPPFGYVISFIRHHERGFAAPVLTVKIRQPSHEFTFGVGMSFIPYPLVLTPVV